MGKHLMIYEPNKIFLIYSWNYSTIYDEQYGNCYTFNSGREDGVIRQSTRTGPSYGMSEFHLNLSSSQCEIISLLCSQKQQYI